MFISHLTAINLFIVSKANCETFMPKIVLINKGFVNEHEQLTKYLLDEKSTQTELLLIPSQLLNLLSVFLEKNSHKHLITIWNQVKIR